MKRLYSEQFYKPDIEAARAALDAHIDYKGGNEPTSRSLKEKFSVQPKDGQWPARLLLDADEITAILNGIAIMDATEKVRLHGPNGSPGEKFRMLEDMLRREIGERGR